MTAWIVSGPGQEWRRIQRNHLELLKEISDASDTAAFSMPDKGVHAYSIDGLNRTDRCVTCHLGMQNPYTKDAAHPHAAHPEGYFEHHPPDQYGCTICHGGQGRALNAREAHGIDRDTHWDRPLLSQPYIQSTCGQCHLSVFSENEVFAGTEVFRQGQQIFNREGCLGCHKARGVGGIIGPDLTEQGEKTRHEYNFQHIDVEQTVSNWLKEHFRDPEMVSPGSQMLKIDLPEEELDALTTFVLGLAKPDIAFDYFTLNTLREFKGERAAITGDRAFSMACAACHGKRGEGKSYEDFEMGVPGIMRNDFRRVASEDYVKFTLFKGRSQRQMASWASDISGMADAEIDELVTRVMHTENTEQPAFNQQLFSQASAEAGALLFRSNCATCHGEEGAGGTAVAVDQEDLLKNADDTFLYQTLIIGRGNATMPSWEHLDENQLYSIVRYLRSNQSFAPQNRNVAFISNDPGEGQLKYLFMCSRCHGEFGQGQTGPAIINADFLEVASDDFLYNTVAYGRSHTAMFGWTSDVYNAERLATEDIGNIVAYMRAQAAEPPDYIYAGANPGNMVTGQQLYKKHCAECHGPKGEGENAPALNNQELLNAASNGYLMATITIGRDGTLMPAWGWADAERSALTGKERQDIVAWIRNWERIRIGF
jgi:mono/diheme cytochrome c family protein